jgi:hypothetical protein
MKKPILSVNRKRIGRPPVGSTLVGVRLPPDELAALDTWIARQGDPQPTRPEAIRHHLKRGLASDTGTPLPAKRQGKPKAD